MANLKICLINLLAICSFINIIVATMNLNIDKCEPIQGECKDQNYTHTSLIGDILSQKIADSIIQSFHMLLLPNKTCSNYMKSFLCTTFKPPCIDNYVITKPCKSMCEHVYKMCYPYIEMAGVSWYSELNCKQFPTYDCIDDPDYPNDYGLIIWSIGDDNSSYSRYYLKTSLATTLSTNSTPSPKQQQQQNDNKIYNLKNGLTLITDYLTAKTAESTKYICFSRESQFQNSNPISSISSSYKCILKCGINIWFNKIEKNFANLCVTIFSSISCITSIITLIIFKKYKKQMIYPELCLMFMSICYIIYSAIYFVSVQIDYQLISCQKITIDEHNINISTLSMETTDQQPSLSLLSSSSYYHQAKTTIIKSVYVSINDITENIYCTIIFLFLNYFHFAILAWWLILSFSLFLINFLKYDLNMLKTKLSTYFHVFAWVLPAVHTIVALLTNKADISEFTGLCSIGNRSPSTLLNFLLIPTITILLLGMMFIAFNFYKIYSQSNLNAAKAHNPQNIRQLNRTNSNQSQKIRTSSMSSAIHQKSLNENKTSLPIENEILPVIVYQTQHSITSSINKSLNKKQLNVSIFTIIFLIPILIVIGCEFYEYININQWYNLDTHIELFAPYNSNNKLSKLNSFLNKTLVKSETINSKYKQYFPNFSIFILKYFMLFISGYTICFYVCFTSNNLKKSLYQLFCKCKNKTSKKRQQGVTVSKNDDDLSITIINHDTNANLKIQKSPSITRKSIYMKEEITSNRNDDKGKIRLKNKTTTLESRSMVKNNNLTTKYYQRQFSGNTQL